MGMEPPAGAPLPGARSASTRPCCAHAQGAAHPSPPDPNARGVPAASRIRCAGAAALLVHAAAYGTCAALLSGAGPRQTWPAAGTEATAAGLRASAVIHTAAPVPRDAPTAEQPAAQGPAPVPALAAAAAAGAAAPSADPPHACRGACAPAALACTMQPGAASCSCLVVTPAPSPMHP